MEVIGYGAAAKWVYGQALEPGDGTTGDLLTFQQVRTVHYEAMTSVWHVAPPSCDPRRHTRRLALSNQAAWVPRAGAASASVSSRSLRRRAFSVARARSGRPQGRHGRQAARHSHRATQPVEVPCALSSAALLGVVDSPTGSGG